ncbi:hypothetical protein [Acidisoma sp.]|uniref:hypothetical protein n=1 Tax=Acidisoma sp. TaxID=1872115 RepID=UPI003B00F988
MTPEDPSDLPGIENASPDLRHAGAVVDQAIDYMTKQSLDPVAIASALLGGAMGMLTMHLGPDAVLAVLDQARASVESGEMASLAEPPAQGHA